MSTIMKTSSFELGTNGAGIDVTSHDDAVTFYVPLTAEQRRDLADALVPGRDFSGVDWKAMYEQAIRDRDAAGAGFPAMVQRLELSERERDEALRKKGEAFDRAVRAERERDAAVARAEGDSWYDAEPDAMPDAGWEPIEPVDRAERERDAAVARAEQAERDRDEADRRTAAAEADRDRWKLHHDRVDGQWAKAEREVTTLRSAGAVTRADIEKAVRSAFKVWGYDRVTGQEWEVLARIRPLFDRIEAEQPADPVEEKARELYRAATPDARWETVADEYRRIARHVLGGKNAD